MSDLENDVTTEEKENSNCEPALEEGACGGIQGLRPSTPYSDGDNLSMEVGFSEGSSHHASDISSVSYQNLLDDDVAGQNLSRHGSEESVDSYLPDYCDDIRGEGTSESAPQHMSSYSDKISDRISSIPIQMSGDQIHIATDDYSLGPKKTSHSVISDPGPDLRVEHKRMSSLPPNSDSLSVQDSFRKHELVVTLREQQRSKSLPPTDSKEEIAKKRNSLEIRNNIPVYGEVKNYEKDVGKLMYSNQGAKPKIKKQSPGLACRVEDKSMTEQTNTGDQEMDKATKIISDLIQVSKANSDALNAQCKKLNQEMEKQSALINGDHKTADNLQSNLVQPPKNTDVENEYEYVKYSRIQEGNSYVGMRLAYSSSETDESKGQTLETGSNSNLVDSSREGTPEKFSSQTGTVTDNVQNNLTEDMLTEIPLNGPDSSNVLDDSKLFTLSPENTECDSVEIESVTSEGDKSPVGMPIVEDGLSSSQTSDVEENAANNTSHSAHSTPRKQLQFKQQQELEKRLYGVDCASMKPREIDAEAIIDDLKLKREALDSAIFDIKAAIQKSKGVALEAPYKESEETSDPIWVKRDEEQVIPRGESTQEIIHSKEEQARERQAIVEKMKKEHEEMYHSEESKLLGNQYNRSNGKIYQTPKGYDSDDEDDEDVRYTRRNKGKKYSQIPKDESVDHSEPSQYSDGDVGSTRKIDSVSMYGDTNMFAYTQDSHSDRRNSESQCSSEDFCSDTESLTKHAYIRKPREGEFDTDEETDRLLEKQYQGNQYVDIPELSQPPVNRNVQAEKRRSRAKEGEEIYFSE